MSQFDRLLTTTKQLEEAVAQFEKASFIAIDTEFMREATYYAQLCLVQISDGALSVAIDPLSPDIDLAPLCALLANPDVLKVFHAGRQDMEIFVQMMGAVPTPVWDTQIAAMVCGLGDQVGYDKLVLHFLDLQIDKSSRFTDWSKRPLSDRQISYALDDVIHLAKIYPMITKRLAKAGRAHWTDEDMAQFASIDLYEIDPEGVWQRIKYRGNKPAMLNRLKHLAAWREQECQRRNLPRNRLLKDETLLDLAGSTPKNPTEFKSIRGFPGGENGKLVHPVLQILAKAENTPKADWPVVPRHTGHDKPPAAVLELLRVLLRHVTEKEGLAPRLVATADELEQLALPEPPAGLRALQGWRYEVFGQWAERLKSGEIGLAIEKGQIKILTP